MGRGEKPGMGGEQGGEKQFIGETRFYVGQTVNVLRSPKVKGGEPWVDGGWQIAGFNSGKNTVRVNKTIEGEPKEKDISLTELEKLNPSEFEEREKSFKEIAAYVKETLKNEITRTQVLELLTGLRQKIQKHNSMFFNSQIPKDPTQSVVMKNYKPVVDGKEETLGLSMVLATGEVTLFTTIR